MRAKSVAIVGATGLVGSKLLEVLCERDFALSRLRLLASARSAGQTINAFGKEHTVQKTTPDAFEGVDICFFAAGSDASLRYVPEAVARGCVVIDKASVFRMDPKVPLVVPEVNRHRLTNHAKVVCSPNCSTIQLVMALSPIENLSRIRRVVACTYQSVSGTGKAAMHELRTQTRDLLDGKPVKSGVYPKQIAFNLIPHLDDFADEGYTKEEYKLMQETKKIMDREDLLISATCVRVPVFVGHSEAVLVETESPLDPVAVRQALEEAPGVVVVDDPALNKYPIPVDSCGKSEVFVGRIRPDLSNKNGVWLWVVADNLLKGAATNAVQIAEALVEDGLV